jgi:hypothetical protein
VWRAEEVSCPSEHREIDVIPYRDFACGDLLSDSVLSCRGTTREVQGWLEARFGLQHIVCDCGKTFLGRQACVEAVRDSRLFSSAVHCSFCDAAALRAFKAHHYHLIQRFLINSCTQCAPDIAPGPLARLAGKGVNGTPQGAQRPGAAVVGSR